MSVWKCTVTFRNIVLDHCMVHFSAVLNQKLFLLTSTYTYRVFHIALMCGDRNINGNKDVRFLECDYLSCVTVHETLVIR